MAEYVIVVIPMPTQNKLKKKIHLNQVGYASYGCKYLWNKHNITFCLQWRISLNLQMTSESSITTYRDTIRTAATRSMPPRRIFHWSISRFHFWYWSILLRMRHNVLTHRISVALEYMLYSLALEEYHLRTFSRQLASSADRKSRACRLHACRYIWHYETLRREW